MSQKKNNGPVQAYFIPSVILMAGMAFSMACNEQRDDTTHNRVDDTSYTMDHTPGHGMKVDSLDLSTVSLPSNYSVISSQKTIKPVWSENARTISANGYIALDPRRDRKVSARFSGRIEKLFIKYNFQYVRKGEKTMEIYSPELNTMQEEYLFLLKNNSDSALAKKAEEKLRLVGINDSQVREIKLSGKTINPIAVTSPYEGYIYFSSGKAPIGQAGSSADQMVGMKSGLADNAIPAGPMNDSEGTVREGSYIRKGQVLFKVNDMKEVLGIVLIDNNNASGVFSGSDVELTSELDKRSTVKSKINLIEPVLQSGQKFLSARVYLNNESGLLKINSLFTAKINSAAVKQLLVPASSILFLGARRIVWIKTGEAGRNGYVFQARDITTGTTRAGMVDVRNGLTDKDQIALDAGYMIDSESLIKVK